MARLRMREEGVPRSPKRLLWRRIEELELPLRPLDVLHGAGIVSLADLVRRSEAEMVALRNFGRKDVTLLRGKLGALGLRFSMVPSRRRWSIRLLRRERSS